MKLVFKENTFFINLVALKTFLALFYDVYEHMPSSRLLILVAAFYQGGGGPPICGRTSCFTRFGITKRLDPLGGGLGPT